MRLYILAAVLVLVCAVLLGWRFSSDDSQANNDKTTRLEQIVAQSMQDENAAGRTDSPETNTEGQQWQSDDPMEVIAYLSANPTTPYREEALAHLQALLSDDKVTKKYPSVLEPSSSEEGFQGKLNSTTLSALLTSSPKFPPIEGLREDVWKGKTCKDCHNWNLKRLCDQATTYQKPSFNPETEGKHPFGVEFRVALRTWSLNGCN